MQGQILQNIPLKMKRATFINKKEVIFIIFLNKQAWLNGHIWRTKERQRRTPHS